MLFLILTKLCNFFDVNIQIYKEQKIIGLYRISITRKMNVQVEIRSNVQSQFFCTEL